MNRIRISGPVRRLGRVMLLLTLGYPQVIIAVPLFVGLLVHVIYHWILGMPAQEWKPVALLASAGVVVALVLLSLLALLHLAAVLYVGWKGHAVVYRRGRWDAVTRPWLHGVISRDELFHCIDALAATHRLIGPVAREERLCDPPVRYFYQPVESVKELALNFSSTVYSPKATLLPPRETLLQFDRTNGRFETKASVDAPPIALIAVHPCDLHAILLLDHVFSRDHRDQHYLARREHMFLVGMDCAGPCGPEAFCREMETDSADQGFDVMLCPFEGPAGSCYGVVFGTDAGREWLESCHAIYPPTAGHERRFEKYLENKRTAFPPRLKKKREQFPAMLAVSYDSLVWEATAEKCYSCGSCNLICPTCYCFDIHDENELPPTKSSRERTWDGCMLRDFAVVAGGQNFRSKPGQRLRHRISRKAAWISERSGLTGCVGCGRCTRACTAHISIVEILNQLAEESDGSKRSHSRMSPVVAGV